MPHALVWGLVAYVTAALQLYSGKFPSISSSKEQKQKQRGMSIGIGYWGKPKGHYRLVYDTLEPVEGHSITGSTLAQNN